VLQRLIHFSALVSYYLHYVNKWSRGYFINSTGLLLAIQCHHVLLRLIHFSALLSNYLQYVNMWWTGFYIFFSTGLVLPTLCQHLLQRIGHFSALVSYDLHYVNIWCSGYLIFHNWSRITYTISTCAEEVTTFFSTNLVLPTICQYVLHHLIHFSTLVSYYLHYINICCSG
jgi:hypothetical protein